MKYIHLKEFQELMKEVAFPSICFPFLSPSIPNFYRQSKSALSTTAHSTDNQCYVVIRLRFGALMETVG